MKTMINGLGNKIKGRTINMSGNPLEKALKFKNFLDDSGLPKVANARDYLSLGKNDLPLFMMITSTYVLPTEELISTLDELIEPESNAIEICCGNGVIGRELNMPLTDSKIQQKDSKIRNEYIRLGNPPVNYPDDVEELEALAAAEKYHPDTILSCFGTHLWKSGMKSGFIYGVDYEKLWTMTNRIILVGNDRVHGENPLMKRKHREIQKWGIISRTEGIPTKIYIWER